MMNRFTTLAASALLSFGALYIPSMSAHAQDLELELGNDGPKLRLRDGDCDPRRERCRDGDRRALDNNDDDDDQELRRARRVCTEDRALDKAERLGIRRARVVSAGRRVIEIRGRDRNGERVEITVGRDRNCPVIG